MEKRKLKILELCHFSAGACGVWMRAKQEAEEMARRGYEVTVFSSNAVKGSEEVAPREETINGVKIRRFQYKMLGGESFMIWKFEKEALEYAPDVIIAHNYRHLPTTKALKVAKELKKRGKETKVFLLTHAPFVEGDITRSLISKWTVKLYDSLIGPRTLNKFDGIITISHWEVPYLIKVGAKKDKITYIPNGIPEEFFEQKKTKEGNKILFLGRVAPKKKLETLISAIPFLKDKKIEIEIVGPPEEEYLGELKQLVEKLKVGNRITFSKPIYDLKEKIKKIDSAKIFILPSRVEGMPQSLIEAMARGKIVIGSDSIAIRDLIKDREKGYLFEFDNPIDLAKKIDLALKENSPKMRKNAKKSVEQFSWNKIVKKIERLINS